jgi:hypothetical protein
LDYIATLHKLEKGGLGYGESDFMLWNPTKLVHQLFSLLVWCEISVVSSQENYWCLIWSWNIARYFCG